MINRVLKTYLDDHQVDYRMVSHGEAFTALQTAQAAHISGHRVAKTVMISVDGDLCMAVCPSSYLIDFDALKREVGSDNCHLVGESQFRNSFQGDVELGGMSPFGNLHQMKVFVDRSLVRDGKIAFNGGNHHEMVEMDYWDFDRLVNPWLLNFASPMGSERPLAA